jgi:putative long chain acyl-CoA synthase
VDPTASVKRGVFAPADTWVSTEQLFLRDEDGDFWLVDNRSSVIRTSDGPVFTAAINDAVSRAGAVDLAVTYRLEVRGEPLVVTAVTLRPGGSLPSAELNEAMGTLPIGIGPAVVYVAPSMTLGASYRPETAPLRAAGIPKASRNAWYFDTDVKQYKRMTAAVRAEIIGNQP